MKSTSIITFALAASAFVYACGGAPENLAETSDAIVRKWNGHLIYREPVRLKYENQLVRGVITGVLANTGDTGDTGGVNEICDLPMGYSMVAGRCQVGLEGGGTMECDCEAEVHTYHDGDGMCVYEVEDIFIMGNCTGDDGETNDPPIVIDQGF